LKEQLQYLIELQHFDARIQELQVAMRALPEKLQPARQDLAKLEGLLQGEKDQLAQTEKWRREQEGVLQQEEDSLRKAKSKLQASSSSREFAAANRELEAKRRGASDREEEVLKVIGAIDNSRKSMAEHEADVAKLREHVQAEATEIEIKVAALQKEIDSHMGGRTAIADKVSRAVLKRYEVVQLRRGVAVVAIIKGACQGCHMQIPPQLINVLARHESIENCPFCHRMVYVAEMLDASPAAPQPPQNG